MEYQTARALATEVIFQKAFYPLEESQIADAKKWIIEKKEIEQLVDVPFENITVKIPCGYDAILTRCYGDYMKLPDEKDRVNHMPVEIQFPGEEVMTFGK